MTERARKIETVLSDWFQRNTEFATAEGFALFEHWEGPFVVTAEVNLSRLADELDREFDRLGALK